ncbi:pilus assembly protein TadG-related protein [Blastococcus sp. TF02A_35]|uniref:pilus assembly protein TadG-related protein n=1 Tax=Blastococcus sp. TF02A-35 TaxID=2559612 RepID=UPI001FD77BD3|nr:pilus assembly protein TadG-related protein [Blastococcus sp. TF02A_35]
MTTRLRRRLAREEGASAAVVALLLVPLLGFAAIAVDVGALYAERARLQVGADAAALAVAQDCARGNCGDMLATARALLDANDPEGTAGQPVLSTNPLSVTVTGSTPKEHWFAPVIGHDATGVSATATVGWGSPSGGTALLPLIFSYCEFTHQVGGPSVTTEQYVGLPKKTETPCDSPKSGNPIPGSFGWLTADPGTCHATSRIDGWFLAETGNNPSKGCEVADLTAMRNQTVLLPLYDAVRGTGSGGEYHVYGYAAFRISGYFFGGQYSWNPPCKGSDRCLSGYFTRFVELSDAWDYSPDAPSLGASVLRLIR